MDFTGNYSSHFSGRRKMALWILVLLIVSLLLQVAGFVSPWWLNIERIDRSSCHLGLWYGILCTDKCQTIDIARLASYLGPYQDSFVRGILEYQIEASFAVFACLLAIVHSYRKMIKYLPLTKMTFYTGFVFCGVSGIMSLVASGKFGKATVDTHYLFRDLNMHSPFGMPYSLLLTGAGGILATIASLVLLFYNGCHGKYEQNNPGVLVMNAGGNGDTACAVPMIPTNTNADLDRPPAYDPPPYMKISSDKPPVYEK